MTPPAAYCRLHGQEKHGREKHRREEYADPVTHFPPASSAEVASPSPEAPVPVRERALLPDVLRGVALLGILTVNMQDFAGYLEWRQTGLDRVAQVLIDVFANGRFISIFAMLFGWGAYGLYRRHGPALFARRHLLLFVLGTAHHLLLWHGDIIGSYAALALLLPWVARWSVRGLLGFGAALGGWWVLTGLLAVWGTALDGQSGSLRFTGLPTLTSAMSYADVLASRLRDFGAEYLGSLIYNAPWLLLLFCLGAAAARAEVLTQPQRFGWLFRRLVAFALPLGLGLGVALAYLNTRNDLTAGLLAVPVRMVGGLLGGLGYVGLFGLLLNRGHLGSWRTFAATGRMALTNYLLQSLVMTSVFYPYAGGQWGRWGAAPALALALIVGLAQLPLSRWWLSRHARGPAEELLRRAVYPRKKYKK